MPKRGRNAILKRFGGRLGRWSVAGLRSCTMRGPRPPILKRSSSSWPLWPRLRRSRQALRGRWRTISAGIAEKEAGVRVGTSSGNSQTPSFGLRMRFEKRPNPEARPVLWAAPQSPPRRAETSSGLLLRRHQHPLMVRHR